MSGLLMSGLPITRLPDYPITRLPDYRLPVTGHRLPITLVFINGRGSHWETEQTTLSHLTAHLS